LLRRIVHLTKNLRHEIDDLVMDLNKLIGKAVDEANAEHGGNQQIHFVDVNPRFTAHRWCEQGDWHEPAPEVDSTWFFLSGWPDVSIEGSEINSIAIEEAEASALISSGRIPLPDANNCKSSLDANADPYERAMCYMAVSIKQHPDGPAAQALNQANNDIKDGNVSSQDIGYFTPTRQIKAFHPRSPGMVAYRDALIEGIEKVGQV
jgi:hypothetical protein